MATKANLVIDQGSTFSVTLTLSNDDGDLLDLNGYTANSQLRKWYTSSTHTDFATEIDTENSTVELSLTANQTSNLTAGRYVYDVELTSSSNDILRIVEGIVTVTPEVTR